MKFHSNTNNDRDGYAEDKAFYEKVLDKLKAEEKSKKANNFICKKLFSHVEFIRYRKQKGTIITITTVITTITIITITIITITIIIITIKLVLR